MVLVGRVSIFFRSPRPKLLRSLPLIGKSNNPVKEGPSTTGKIPEEVLAGLDWPDLILDLTAFAHRRLRGASVEEAKQLAMEAIRVFLDPDSTVMWDYKNEPDPSRCLGSIVNGLGSNYFRRKSTTEEVATDDVEVEMRPDGVREESSPEERVIACDLRRKVLSRVYELSARDDLVQTIVLLADDGIIDPDQQMEHLNVSKPQLYEARRRFQKLVAIVRRELEEGS